MSGSAANASARRRRANNPEQENNVVEDKKIQQEKRGLTPLQILQSHETRIKELEKKTDEIKNIDINNLNNLPSNKLKKDDNLKSEENISIDIEKKIKQNLENVSNNQIDIEKKLTGELSLLNDKIGVLINENISLKNELEELKDIRLMVIKSQTLGLETSNKLFELKTDLDNVNKLLENDSEKELIDNEETMGVDLLKHIFMNRMNNNNLNNYDEDMVIT